jgi:hypothetical protein
MSRPFNIVVAVIVLAGAIAYVVHASRIESQLHQTRAQLDQARITAARAAQEADDLSKTLRQREHRFVCTSHACARLINEYVVRAERLGYAANETANNGRPVAGLADYLYGEARGAADGRCFLDQDIDGCGMKVVHPRRFPTGEVSPVASDWRDGTEPPSFP